MGEKVGNLRGLELSERFRDSKNGFSIKFYIVLKNQTCFSSRNTSCLWTRQRTGACRGYAGISIVNHDSVGVVGGTVDGSQGTASALPGSKVRNCVGCTIPSPGTGDIELFTLPLSLKNSKYNFILKLS